MTDTTETWLPVVGYEGLYEVSDHGRVRGLDRITTQGQPITGRVLRPAMTTAGRPGVGLAWAGKTKTHRVSVLVLTAFVGPRPDGYQGCHNDGDPANNHLENLRWDTAAANSRDTILHGRNQELRKTHCPRGHLLEAPNISYGHVRRGKRTCLACHRSLCERRRAELRGEPFDIQQDSNARYAAIMRAAEVA